MADGDIDGPERFVVSLVVEGDGEWFEWCRDVGEGVCRAHRAAGGAGGELLDAACHERGYEGGHEEHCGEFEVGCVRCLHRISLRDARLSGKIGLVLALIDWIVGRKDQKRASKGFIGKIGGRSL